MGQGIDQNILNKNGLICNADQSLKITVYLYRNLRILSLFARFLTPFSTPPKTFEMNFGRI